MPLHVKVITDLDAQAEVLKYRRYGVIEAVDGRFRRVLLRPFPKLISIPEVLLGGWMRRFRPGDRCLVFYDQSWRYPNFLMVKYIVSSRETTYATGCRAMEALDEIARIKGSDALLATVANWRISGRLLARWGWEQHCHSRWLRHYIKRFYGQYPPRPAWLGGPEGQAAAETSSPLEGATEAGNLQVEFSPDAVGATDVVSAP